MPLIGTSCRLLLSLVVCVNPGWLLATETATDQMLFLKGRMLYEADQYREAQDVVRAGNCA